MPFRTIRDRFLWRLRAPLGPGEIRRTERWLASARVFLAVSALVAIWMDPREIRYSIYAFGLLAFYIAQGMIIIIFLRRRQRSTTPFRVLVHSADLLWPAVISVFASGESNPFFLFFIFVLAAAAYRWGLWETVGTAAAAVILLWLESFSFQWGVVGWLDAFLRGHHLPALQLDPQYFEPKRLFIRSVSLLVVGLLLGYLAEQQKQLRAEKAVIARFLGRARVESGLTGTLQAIMGELLSVYGAMHVVMATQEASNYRIYVADVRPSEAEPVLRWLDPTEGDKDTYLYDSKAAACHAERDPASGQEISVMAMDAQGNKIEKPDTEFLGKLGQKYRFQAVMAASFVFGQEWRGRLFLLDPTLTSNREEELHFLQELVQQVSPAVYNVLLLRRLRLRAGALERARFARELHDGAVQSLIAVEMQVDVLRRQASRRPEIMPDELGRIQGLLREEVLKLRELMQQMKTLDVDSRKLPGLINDTVERFQRETGITARFHSDVRELKMPQPVCREVARIVQEALVNVRKHSQARQVLVRLGSMNGNWKVEIEDDGRGFPFSGRFSQDELDSLGKGPVVIKERVRLIEGKLTIESTPGRGSRLEVIVPQQQGAIHG